MKRDDNEVSFVHFSQELMDKIERGDSSIKREGRPGEYRYYDEGWSSEDEENITGTTK